MCSNDFSSACPPLVLVLHTVSGTCGEGGGDLGNWE